MPGTSEAPAAASAGSKRAPLLYLIGAAVQGLAAILVQPFSVSLFGGVRSAGWSSTAFAVTIMQVGLVVLSAGLPLAITRAWLEPEDGPVKARAIGGFNHIFALTAAAAACLASWILQAEPAVIAAIWSMGALAVVLAAQAQLRAEGKPLQFVALAAGSSLFAHLCGLAAILLFETTSACFMAGFATASTLTAAAAVLLTRPSLPGAAPAAVRSALVTGLPLLPHSLAMILLSQGDAFLLNQFAPHSEKGVYLSAAAFALGPIAVLAGLNNSWSPAIMKAGHETSEAFEATVRSTLKTSTTIAAAMSVLGSLGAWVGMLVLARGDHDATRVAAVLPLVGIGYAVYLVAMSVLFARLATHSFAWLTVSVVVISAVIGYWPARSADLVMVAYVKALAFTLLGAGYAVMARGKVSFPLRRPAALLAGSAAVSVAVLAGLGVLYS